MQCQAQLWSNQAGCRALSKNAQCGVCLSGTHLCPGVQRCYPSPSPSHTKPAGLIAKTAFNLNLLQGPTTIIMMCAATQHPLGHPSIQPADGACTLCSNAAHILVPLNALYINAPGQGSQVRTTAGFPQAVQAASVQHMQHGSTAPYLALPTVAQNAQRASYPVLRSALNSFAAAQPGHATLSTAGITATRVTSCHATLPCSA